MSDDFEKPCGYPVLECRLSDIRAVRIEALEAKLAKAVEALGHYATDESADGWHAIAALAAIKGEANDA